MKLLLVDDHLLFLEGLAQVLNYYIDDVEILKSESVSCAIPLIKTQPNIDLALVDLAMPQADGINFICQAKEVDEFLPIAVLSASDDALQIKQALDQGALGFIPKTYKPQQLINAILLLLAGQKYIPQHIDKLLLTSGQKQTKVSLAKEYDITSRQLEVLSLLAKGLSNNEIAQLLYISEHTVKSHLKQLFQKLDSSNRVSCINQAKKIGLI